MSVDPIEGFFRSHSDEIFADLKYLVSFPSVRGEAVPGAPFGAECARCLDATAGLFRYYGFETDVYQERGYAMAWCGGRSVTGSDYTGIFSHCDVVPVIPSDWKLTSPFDMYDNGDLVVGRGVSDDKQAIIAALYLFRAVRELGLPLRHPLGLFIGANEESGMKDVRNFRDAGPIPAVAVVPDGGFPVSLGERGSFHADITCLAPFTDVVSVSGGSAYNVVLGCVECVVRRSAGLQSFLDANPREWLSVADEGDTVRLVARGVSAHGGRPYLGESALLRLSSLLSGFDGFRGSDRKIFAEIADMLSDCYGTSLGIADDDPDMSRLTAANGIVKTEDGRLTFTLDIRFGPGVDKSSAKETLAANVAARGFSLSATAGSTAFTISPDDPLAAAFLASYRRLCGKPDAKHFYMTGGTYSKILISACPSFTTGVALGSFVGRLGLGDGYGKCHEPDECLGKEEFLRGASLLGGIILDMDRAY